jgi:hypothetical protein
VELQSQHTGQVGDTRLLLHPRAYLPICLCGPVCPFLAVRCTFTSESDLLVSAVLLNPSALGFFILCRTIRPHWVEIGLNLEDEDEKTDMTLQMMGRFRRDSSSEIFMS